MAPRHVLAFGGIIGIACVGLTAQQPRDNQPAAIAGTATVSGHVFVDAPTKQPARHASVTLTEVTRVTPGQTATTDDGGGFQFRAVPAGRFELQATKNGYLRASYGATRPERAGTPIVVKDGDTIADLAVTIARGGVITGVVRDTHGQPVPGIPVRALRLSYNALNGERTVGLPSSGSIATTDDRGAYRAYGLPPGGYLLLANLAAAPGHFSPPAFDDDIRPLTRAEVDQALQATRTGAMNSRPAPASPSASAAARVNYAPIFYPGVTDIGTAGTITLGLSEERRGVDVTVQLVATATITGTVRTPEGVAMPPSVRVTLVPAGGHAEMLAGAGIRGASAQPRTDGAYKLAGVAPGNYTIKAGTPLGGRGMSVPGPSLWAAADVQVNGQNLEVPLTLQPGVTITGRVVFEGAPPTPDELRGLVFRLVPPASGGMILGGDGGRVDAQGHFTFTGVVPDAYHFLMQWPTPGAGNRWIIKSSTANDRESFDAPLRVNPNETLDWTITFTGKPTNLTGVFQDRGGRAATDYYILVYPSDRTLWTPGSRRIQTTRPATDGAFGVKGLPPGEYFLAALTDLESGEWNDPALLEELIPSALKVTLRDGATTTQDVRIGGR
jgi:hypothetical protein